MTLVDIEPEPPVDITPENPSDEVVDLEALESKDIAARIRFVWRPEDQAALDRVELIADELFVEYFGEAIDVIDTFYMALRVPQVNDYGQVLMTGYPPRPLWRKDEVTGKFIENWEQLTGQDIEQTLLNLERIRLVLVPKINKLKSHAIYARMVADDVKDDAWKTVAQGTTGDKGSKANRVSRADRYHAFMRYHLWTTADVFDRELVNFCYRLKDIRNWRNQSQMR